MHGLRPKITDIRWPSAFGIFGLGIIVGTILAVFQIAKVTISSGASVEIAMSQVDIIVIVLAAVAVIVTALGVIFAILAFWGYINIKDAAINAAVDEIKRRLSENGDMSRDNHDGALKDYIKQTAQKAAVQEVKTQFSVDDQTQRIAGGELRDYIEKTIERVTTEVMLKKQGRGQFFGDEDTDYGVTE